MNVCKITSVTIEMSDSDARSLLKELDTFDIDEDEYPTLVDLLSSLQDHSESYG